MDTPNFTHNADDEFAHRLRAYQVTGYHKRVPFEFDDITVYAEDSESANAIRDAMVEWGIIKWKAGN